MVKTDDIEVRLSYDALKIFFMGTLHLRIKLSELIAVQSWRTGDGNFSIEYTLRGNDVLTQYDDVEKWKAILQGIEKALDK